MMYPSNL